MNNSHPLEIRVLLTESQILAGVERAFEQRFLAEQYFYWFPSSVRSWVHLCRSTEYRNANRAMKLLRRCAPQIRNLWRHAQTLCGIGCGEGSKDAVLLETFPLSYIAADFSQPLLELAMQAALAAGAQINTTGYKLDIFNDAHLHTLCEAAQISGATIYSVLGNTLGAFGPHEFPGRLRASMSDGDRVLFDGEVLSSDTLAGYDNPTNRRFAFAPLTGVGITEADGELIFGLQDGREGLAEVTKYFVARRDLRINLGGVAIEIAAGERLRMSSSIKYGSAKVLKECVESAGFEIELLETSSDDRFVLIGAKPDHR
jgi:uncharacterized SAM-dependent methyltransferase